VSPGSCDFVLNCSHRILLKSVKIGTGYLDTDACASAKWMKNCPSWLQLRDSRLPDPSVCWNRWSYALQTLHINWLFPAVVGMGEGTSYLTWMNSFP